MSEEIYDPGAVLAIKLLDNMLSNDTTSEMKALGEAAKANLQISCKNNIVIGKHINDDNVHTVRGMILQKGVLKWLFVAFFVTSMLVTYVPGILRWFISLF